MATRFHSGTVRVNAESATALLRRKLLRWYRRHRRDLPWRRTTDPYKIWVSEVMLQQTRVEVVRDFYKRWLKLFPTIETLARAPSAKVLKQWEGLGYYSRARNLHRAARILQRQSDPASVPRQLEELRRLPGIGRYTAGAIASIAFGAREPIVDGNVARVLARLFNIHKPIKDPATTERLWKLAAELVPARSPGDFNQALMELGALVCLPRSPDCPKCPLRNLCRARDLGTVERLPNRGPQRRPTSVIVDAALVKRGHRILLQRRPDTGQLAGMWELPRLAAHPFQVGRFLLTLRHTITNRRITLRILACTLTTPLSPRGPWRWASPGDLSRLTLPAAERRALMMLANHAPQIFF